MLYERRFGPFFVNPVVAGIDSKTGEPYISSMDVIGCMTEPSDFAVAGTCEEQLFGMYTMQLLKVLINIILVVDRNIIFDSIFTRHYICIIFRYV